MRPPLIDTWVYRMTPERPQLVRTLEQGDVAFYGPVLEANGDAALARTLLADAVDGLWEYEHGFGPTAEDSALVLDGLLAAGADQDVLRRSAARLVDTFFDDGAGAFHTVHGGRARYWAGPSIDATAHVGWLLSRLDATRWKDQIAACRAFVRAARADDGFWRSRWFPSALLTTFLAARLLGDDPVVADVRTALADAQRDDGSFGGSVVDTAFAVRTLADAAAVARGRAWLTLQRGPHGWAGEPVLYYTMETPDPGVRFFFHCVDKGPITSAWATLALRG